MRVHWYLVHTKPRQEQRARENLERQGYPCYLPLMPAERLRQGRLEVAQVPLFPRYLFIRLDSGQGGAGWGPIRSTLGVTRLVAFGGTPARVPQGLIDVLQAREAPEAHPYFAPGERVRVASGPFAGLEAVYQMSDGTERVQVLIEFMTRPVLLGVAPDQLRKM